MPTAILTEDFLGICLILANGDINIELEEVICRAEAYQKSSDCHFGITRDDFRNAFSILSFETYHEAGFGDYEEMLMERPLLQHWIDPILNYEDIYFNDEGEHWCDYEKSLPSETNLKMRNFFTDKCNHSPEIVLRFINELGKNHTTLRDCSRRGSWS